MNLARRCAEGRRALALLPAVFLCLVALAGCGTRQPEAPSAPPSGTRAETQPPKQTEPQAETRLETETTDRQSTLGQTEAAQEEPVMKLEINGREISVLWEDNESVLALRALAADAPLSIQLSPYGGFEQVGPIGQSLPRNDAQTTTEPGDIVLYSGNQIVVFYGSNSWAYTRLGRIQGLDRAELTRLLGNGAVTLTLSFGTEAAAR